MNKLLLSAMLALGICGQGFAEESSVKDKSDLLAEQILEVGIGELRQINILVMQCDRMDSSWDFAGYPLSILGMVDRALTTKLGGEITKEDENLILLTAAKVQKKREGFDNLPSSRGLNVEGANYLAYLLGRAVEESGDKEGVIYEECTQKLKENYESFEKKILENIKL